jgi:hypothetical protein
MRKLLAFAGWLLLSSSIWAQQVFEMPSGIASRLSSFENPNGKKGEGGQSNKTAKGRAFETVKTGVTKTLLDINGEGIVQRIWLTIDQNPKKLRSLRLQMFWDNAAKAAVDVPLGDFFGYNLGRKVAFQNVFFSSGEGRSFNCYVPMPFRKGARIILTNEGPEEVKLFYDVDFVLQKLPAASLYFHAYWTRQMSSKLGDDFLILPNVKAKGRFLGITVGVNTDSAYGKSWWGEGEVKMYLDGDKEFPTIVGTGTEDYIGSAWGLGTFVNQYQGCTVADDSLGQYNFYRWHVPDAIYFKQELKVVLQQIGGWMRNDVRQLLRKGAQLKPITVDAAGGFVTLLDNPNAPSINDQSFPDGWVNFYRIDDYSAVSYLYLDQPESSLPTLPTFDLRVKNLR